MKFTERKKSASFKCLEILEMKKQSATKRGIGGDNKVKKASFAFLRKAGVGRRYWSSSVSGSPFVCVRKPPVQSASEKEACLVSFLARILTSFLRLCS